MIFKYMVLRFWRHIPDERAHMLRGGTMKTPLATVCCSVIATALFAGSTADAKGHAKANASRHSGTPTDAEIFGGFQRWWNGAEKLDKTYTVAPVKLKR